MIYGPADATATPSFFCTSKIQNGLPFGCRLTHVVLEKRPLSGCSSSSSITYVPIRWQQMINDECLLGCRPRLLTLLFDYVLDKLCSSVLCFDDRNLLFSLTV